MAVELRCPKCKAKLRLPVEPEPDSEIECSKCEHVFPWEENLVHAGAADDGDRPRKKKAVGGEGAKKAAADKKAAPAAVKKRKKKKSKKRKTPPLMIAGIVAGVLMFLAFAGVIVWFFTKKSSFQEMITYLPDDCDSVVGVNLGHLQKYPEFYKTVQQTFANTGFKAAGDTLAKAMGRETIDDVVDYVVQGNGYVGGQSGGARLDATVFKTKEEYDPAVLAKIPGAREGTVNGVKVYAIPNIPALGYSGLRVFGPTNRIVVFCSGSVPENKLSAMVQGNKDNSDNTPYARAGNLGKQTIRGSVWRFTITAGRSAPGFGGGAVFESSGGEGTGGDDEGSKFNQEWTPVVQNMKGIGIKASAGSREVRGEVLIQYADSETASNMLTKWKEKEWIKDEEQEVPKWFKSLANKSGAGKTAVNVVRDGLAFRSSGDVFIIRASVETKLLTNGLSTLVSEFTKSGSQGAGPGGGLPGGPGGMPGGPPRPRRRVHPLAPRRPARLQS
ncbi:MAG TPA: hypothetical protein VM597_29390, partial [Gemmataceae bacterium]|nr:hypothetical protein [Gemmataceae bacterium]